ncbi:histidine kinase [Chitinophaga horti]|uniref:Histidine kinase n=1 Tax=Chitinophaga horti TaxID=2920382 RepID=A0ABY6IZD1_9BACT|nr:histidine kinase [Chitinophaga horti]UYQ92735.1 histidine kinase [Chitinophaga horti]
MKNASWPYWVITISGAAALISLVVWRERKWKGAIRRQQEVKQSWRSLELHAFQAQLDPAFIFNSLSAIHNFILTTSTDEASRHLMSFAKLMRLTIENSRREWITLSDELEALELYLQLEQLRFGQKFTYHIKVMRDVDQEQTLIPPFIIQPYARHAIYRRLLMRQQATGGVINIEVGRTLSHLYIRMEDNGAHRAATLTPEPGNEGADIAAERIQLMNVRYDTHAEIITRHLYDQQRRVSGTYTVITLPDTSQQPAADGQKIFAAS